MMQTMGRYSFCWEEGTAAGKEELGATSDAGEALRGQRLQVGRRWSGMEGEQLHHSH